MGRLILLYTAVRLQGDPHSLPRPILVQPLTMSSKKKGSMSENLHEKKTRVGFTNPAPVYPGTSFASDTYQSLGVDNKFDINDLMSNLKIKIIDYKPKEGLLVFDLIGVDAPVANAFRRILLSEIPTMAIEHVWIHNNTSIIQDEVLAHRLGLIPIKVDPRKFEFKKPGEEETDETTLVFKLKVRCTRSNNTNPQNPEEAYVNSKVYSRDLIWEPVGGQAELFADDPPRPVHDDILIAKLRPGQEIEVECRCAKGEGKEHAKWSPVSTAYYRLLPDIKFVKDFKGQEAKKLVAKCPMNVFDIEDSGKAYVKNQRNCTMCRECIREDGWDKRIKLLRVKDHFIFSIESTGILPPNVLFEEAVKVFMAKCHTVLTELDNLHAQ